VAATPGTPALRLVAPQRGGSARPRPVPAVRTPAAERTGARGGARDGEREVAARRPAGSASPSRASIADAARLDATLLRFLVACLCGFGLVMVLASSSVTSIAQYGSPWSMFERQTMWTVIGAAVFAVGTRVSLERIRRLTVPLLVATTGLLVVVLVPHLGKSAGGSSRWIGFGPLTLQPSELMKLVYAMFAADLVARREHARDHARELVRPLGIVLAFLAILIVKQPDMGTAIVLVCMTTAILFVAGVHRRLLGASFVLVSVVGGVVALAAPYRRARLLSFLNPFGHASTTGYQVVQSLVTLGAGHVTGAGVGTSPAIWGWLPNAQTDFVFAVVGNQLGLVGSVLVVAAFACLGWLGLRVATRAEDRFSSLLAATITCWVVCQAMINIGGVVGAMPETGIPLPFLSAGGSSLVVLLGAMGLLVNVARRPRAAGERRARRPQVSAAPGGRR